MDFLASNLQLIKQWRPYLYACLEKHLSSELSVFQDANGAANFYCDSAKQKPFYELPLEQEYQRSLALTKLAQAKIYVFDGIGLGHHIFEFFKTTSLQDDISVLFLEKHPLHFIAALKCRDWRLFLQDGRCEFFVGLAENMMVPACKEFFKQQDRIIYSQAMGHFYLFQALTHDGAYYLKFAEAAKQALGEMNSLYMAPPEDAYRGFLNLCENLPQLAQYHVVSKLKGFLNKRPALIVSSGPSLQAHLPEIKKHQDKIFIACSDSSLRILLKHNIVPHVAFCLERSESIQNLIKALPKDCQVPLVTMPTTFPQVIKNYPGPVLMVPRETTFGRWLWPEEGFFHLGNNVASMALRLVAYFDCGDVYFVGQDLAYDRFSERSHVDGISNTTQTIELGRKKTAEYCELMGNDGSPIASTIYWKSFLEQLNDLLVRFNVNAFNVIPKKSGAALQNAAWLDPEEFWQSKIVNFAKQDYATELKAKMQGTQGFAASYYARLVKQTLNSLDHLLQAALAFLDETSMDIHLDFPETNDLAQLARYDEVFKKWKQKERALQIKDEALFLNFIKPLLSSWHYKILTSRVSLQRNTDGVPWYLFGYFDFTQEWLKHFVYVMMRAKHLLEKVKF